MAETFSEIVESFERRFLAGDASDFQAFVATLAPRRLDGAKLLLELACRDIELRSKSGRQGRSAAWYASRYPELNNDAAIGELTLEEFRAEQRAHGVTVARFVAARGISTTRTIAELQAIAAEIARETARDKASPPSLAQTFLASAAFPRLDLESLVLRRAIGYGRSSKVYKADLSGQESPVAVKFLRKEYLYQRGAVEQFLSEAAVLFAAPHPRIVSLLGVATSKAGAVALVLKWLPGGDLAHCHACDWREACRWILEAAEGVAYAHKMGILHCDLKPSNLLLDASGRVCVADFGLARRHADVDSRGAPGTPAFAAPEQSETRLGPVGFSTDVFGLGASLYWLLTHRSVWGVDQSCRRRDEPIPFVHLESPDLPISVATAIRKSVLVQPHERFSTVNEFRVALAAAAGLVCVAP